MELNEVKKRLYKEDIEAELFHIRYGQACYVAFIGDWAVYMDVPVDDMGTAPFYSKMPAKQLIRWIVTPQMKYERIANS